MPFGKGKSECLASYKVSEEKVTLKMPKGKSDDKKPLIPKEKQSRKPSPIAKEPKVPEHKKPQPPPRTTSSNKK